VHQKCSNYTLTNLFFGLCKFVWIIDSLVAHLSPHLGILACPSTPKVLRARRSTPTPCPFAVFTFGFAVESLSRSLGVRHPNNHLLSCYFPSGTRCIILLGLLLLPPFWVIGIHNFCPHHCFLSMVIVCILVKLSLDCKFFCNVLFSSLQWGAPFSCPGLFNWLFLDLVSHMCLHA
jgi:hypothetical protein